jgi:hypothetical protein
MHMHARIPTPPPFSSFWSRDSIPFSVFTFRTLNQRRLTSYSIIIFTHLLTSYSHIFTHIAIVITTRVIAFRVPHNGAVQIYDYKLKKSRVIFGPDLVMLGPDEQVEPIPAFPYLLAPCTRPTAGTSAPNCRYLPPIYPTTHDHSDPNTYHHQFAYRYPVVPNTHIQTRTPTTTATTATTTLTLIITSSPNFRCRVENRKRPTRSSHCAFSLDLTSVPISFRSRLPTTLAFSFNSRTHPHHHLYNRDYALRSALFY